jgi:hypothetical protein
MVAPTVKTNQDGLHSSGDEEDGSSRMSAADVKRLLANLASLMAADSGSVEHNSDQLMDSFPDNNNNNHNGVGIQKNTFSVIKRFQCP